MRECVNSSEALVDEIDAKAVDPWYWRLFNDTSDYRAMHQEMATRSSVIALY
jgi:hypothetical protein